MKRNFSIFIVIGVTVFACGQSQRSQAKDDITKIKQLAEEKFREEKAIEAAVEEAQMEEIRLAVGAEEISDSDFMKGLAAQAATILAVVMIEELIGTGKILGAEAINNEIKKAVGVAIRTGKSGMEAAKSAVEKIIRMVMGEPALVKAAAEEAALEKAAAEAAAVAEAATIEAEAATIAAKVAKSLEGRKRIIATHGSVQQAIKETTKASALAAAEAKKAVAAALKAALEAVQGKMLLFDEFAEFFGG